jgi:hypothetical protein
MDAPELVAELRRVADEIEHELQQMPGYLRHSRIQSLPWQLRRQERERASK